jgi:hypothetical protein
MGQFDSVAGFWISAKLTHSARDTEQIAILPKMGNIRSATRDHHPCSWPWALQALAGWASFSLVGLLLRCHY